MNEKVVDYQKMFSKKTVRLGDQGNYRVLLLIIRLHPVKSFQHLRSYNNTTLQIII